MRHAIDRHGPPQWRLRRMFSNRLVFEEFCAGDLVVPATRHTSVGPRRLATSHAATLSDAPREILAVPVGAATNRRTPVRRPCESRLPAALRRTRITVVLRAAFRRKQ